MKNFLGMLAFTGVLLVINFKNASAQKEPLTAKSATKAMGYTILNPGEAITIYKYVHSAHSPKEADRYAPKYFFAAPSLDTLNELTKMNLKKAFPENHAFHDALDATFNIDGELINYDSFHKMYKINRLYKASMK